MTDGRSFGKYLGYPICINKLERNDLQFLLENFKCRLAGWKVNLLSAPGRAPLIRSTLNSLPNHGTTPTHKKLHLLKWSRITQPKDSGGLGIQDLHTKNKASCVNCLETFPITRLPLGKGVSLRMLIEGPLTERETTLTVANILQVRNWYLLHRMGDPRVSHVYREQNKLADALAAVAITTTFVDNNTAVLELSSILDGYFGMGSCIVEECKLRPTPVGLCLILVRLGKFIHQLLVRLFL
ncbi:hypothetical protein KY290_001663 [Solanum tuberosum]|uniref:RNase H type-1 domain-containing protein n=1 Tax=Solanum tuberosum TaxID=4113 RepID=A0ABQ7WMY4_SOLTU|nr:hypothetical protein KY290_001663 [Solanum tuberosum]